MLIPQLPVNLVPKLLYYGVAYFMWFGAPVEYQYTHPGIDLSSCPGRSMPSGSEIHTPVPGGPTPALNLAIWEEPSLLGVNGFLQEILITVITLLGAGRRHVHELFPDLLMPGHIPPHHAAVHAIVGVMLEIPKIT
jgi:hypothetical protein